MTSLTRRLAPATVALVALFAAAVPGTAAAKGPKTDQFPQCEGAAHIEGLGSTFQAPAEFLWTGESFPKDGFNVSTSKLACSGTHKPTVRYNNSKEEFKGSGNCLKDMGSAGAPKIHEFPFCGTDEAPSKTVKEAMEASAGLSEKGEGIQTIPVLQGAVAVIVHLPKGCTATSEPDLNKKVTKLGRLSLERSVIDGIYDGSPEYSTWKKALSHNKTGNNKLTCSPEPTEAEEEITRVVRLDKSGTTHIFKAFLLQVSPGEFKMEKFGEINEKAAGKESVNPCGAVLPEENKTWQQVSEGCENQRWPTGTKPVLRGIESGNPGVIKSVSETPSSIGYADMAVAREKGNFSDPAKEGGEGFEKFWVTISNSKEGSKKVEYQDPATNGDEKELGNSNCVKTVYAAEVTEKFPPASTRDDWSKVKGLAAGKTYSICGLTYVLAPRLYFPFLHHEVPATTEEEARKVATTVSNYITWVLNEKTEGGGEEVEGHDYEPLPKKAQKVAEAGALEIGGLEA